MEPAWAEPPEDRLQPGDCVKVAAFDRLVRSLTEVLELLGWPRENRVEVISLRESIDQDSGTGRAMLHLAIVFAEMERDLARERTLAGPERVRATGKQSGGARALAGSGPMRYRACVSATASHGVASPRLPGCPQAASAGSAPGISKR